MAWCWLVLALITRRAVITDAEDEQCEIRPDGTSTCTNTAPEPACKNYFSTWRPCDLPVIHTGAWPWEISPGGHPEDDEDEELLAELLERPEAKEAGHPAAALVKMHWRTSPVIIRGGAPHCSLNASDLADTPGPFQLQATIACTDAMAKTNYHFRSQWYEAQKNHDLCNVSFSNFTKLLEGTISREELGLPEFWQARIMPSSTPRVGFSTKDLAEKLHLQGLTAPEGMEPLFSFEQSGFWAAGPGTRTPFHDDSKIQLVATCSGTKRWYFAPGREEIGNIPGEGPFFMHHHFHELMDFAWHKSGPFDMCANDSVWTFSTGHVPRFRRCLMRPDDLLYLPYGFGHDVEALEATLHITLRFMPRGVYTLDDVGKSQRFQAWAEEHYPRQRGKKRRKKGS